MEIRLLRYFLAAAEERNVSRAARALHITQPTLSRQLKEFEESLGAELFVRQNKELVLTEAGQFLKSRAEEILELAERTEREFEDQKKTLFSGHVSIGCVEADNSDTVAMMLEELVGDYPQVTFTIFSGTSDMIVEKLEKGLLDLAVLLEPVDTKQFEKLVLPREERWGLLVSRESFLAAQDAIKIADLAGIPLLSSSRAEVQAMIESWSKEQGVPFQIVGRFNLIFNVFPLVENHVGSALGIEGAVSNQRSDTLKFLPLVPEVKTNCVLVWKKNRELSPAVSVFLQYFKDAFEA
ncbi:regulatory helix-turn-helix lysR family protein [Listeria floridensis FSL S10-1187]|uniref:Regulatory helix-turn-helix lysR family protein n=1 Tax=Listeria floridensis FSL S10-1187 TaxID=1265817 RepID=A0ABP3B1S1_9LIST|nr:LysR family transcriptional regulator [Listeria floridensis]EUJ33865.1 regulatory helix-turn-helix lysR family protein [Listeria floridensis FSL S10-1187]